MGAGALAVGSRLNESTSIHWSTEVIFSGFAGTAAGGGELALRGLSWFSFGAGTMIEFFQPQQQVAGFELGVDPTQVPLENLREGFEIEEIERIRVGLRRNGASAEFELIENFQPQEMDDREAGGLGQAGFGIQHKLLVNRIDHRHDVAANFLGEEFAFDAERQPIGGCAGRDGTLTWEQGGRGDRKQFGQVGWAGRRGR